MRRRIIECHRDDCDLTPLVREAVRKPRSVSGPAERAARRDFRAGRRGSSLAGWRTRPEVAIVAIHDPVSERRHHAINLVRNARVYDDLDLMLDGEALDFVDIASPPAFHAAAVRKALEAGANVLVEKPICLSVVEFEELAALAARKSRVLMCSITGSTRPPIVAPTG